MRHVVKNPVAELRAALAHELSTRWLMAWLQLRRQCHDRLAGAATDAGVAHAVRILRRAGDSAAIFGVDLLPLYFRRPDEERAEIISVAGDALRAIHPPTGNGTIGGSTQARS